jgi:hypothetical protein
MGFDSFWVASALVKLSPKVHIICNALLHMGTMLRLLGIYCKLHHVYS